jgi:hypothetical protein
MPTYPIIAQNARTLPIPEQIPTVCIHISYDHAGSTIVGVCAESESLHIPVTSVDAPGMLDQVLHVRSRHSARIVDALYETVSRPFDAKQAALKFIRRCWERMPTECVVAFDPVAGGLPIVEAAAEYAAEQNADWSSDAIMETRTLHWTESGAYPSNDEVRAGYFLKPMSASGVANVLLTPRDDPASTPTFTIEKEVPDYDRIKAALEALPPSPEPARLVNVQPLARCLGTAAFMATNERGSWLRPRDGSTGKWQRIFDRISSHRD